MNLLSLTMLVLFLCQAHNSQGIVSGDVMLFPGGHDAWGLAFKAGCDDIYPGHSQDHLQQV